STRRAPGGSSNDRSDISWSHSSRTHEHVGPSEHHLHRELNDSWTHAGRGDSAEGRARDVRVRVRKVHGVERIEKLHSELRLSVGRGPTDSRALHHREVDVPLTRSADDSDAAIAKVGGAAVAADDSPSDVGTDARGVEVLIDQPFYRAWKDQI